MRIERSITTVSWIPSEMMEGLGRMATRMKMAHDDVPPPDSLGADVPAMLDELRAADRFRFANHLRAWIDVDAEGRVVGHGSEPGGMIGATTVGLGVGSITIPALKLPDRCPEPRVGDSEVTFTQTVGGRTGAPMPRTVKHPPFVQYHAPIVWTTLELTIRADGTHTASMIGASGFPRHWVYDDTGTLVAKSSLADYKSWMGRSFGRRTPWGDAGGGEGSEGGEGIGGTEGDGAVPTLVTDVETLLERELQGVIMRGGPEPDVRRVKAGRTLVEQGAPDSGELFLLLNGVLAVEVDGEGVAEIGPGAVLGERALLDGGRRTATLRAVTACKVAAVPIDRVDVARLGSLAADHRREETRPATTRAGAPAGPTP